MTTMVCGAVRLIWRRTSMPSMPGSTMSSMANSGRSRAKISRASSPVIATNTSKPSSRNAREMVRRVRASSSSMRIECAIRCLHDYFFFLLYRHASFLPYRQRDTHGGAMAGKAIHADVAAVTADIGVADAEAEAGSLAALGGKERFKNVRQDICRNAGARVGDREFQ